MSTGTNAGQDKPKHSALGSIAARMGFQGPTIAISSGVGIGSFSSNFWTPFMPLYLLHIGATSQQNALGWMAVALTGQGVGRIIGGPIWGVLADRYGRKVMFVRALYANGLTALLAGLALAPWHVGIAYTAQGFLGGFIPAAVALTSVSVPRERLQSGLATVTAAQYLGTTIGPAIGAVLVSFFGLRGAVLTGAVLPCVAAVWVTFAVPRDQIGRAPVPTVAFEVKPRWNRRLTTMLSAQLIVALIVYFVLYTTDNIVRVTTPLVLGSLAGPNYRTAAAGVTFAFGGIGSIVGALVIARFLVRESRARLALTAVAGINAAIYVLLARAGTVPMYVVWFALVEAAHGTMIPSTNALIAMSVRPERRGTAFGIASSVQAAAFGVGPTVAAITAKYSLSASFLVVAAMFAVAALVVLLFLRPTDRSRFEEVAQPV